MHGAVALEVADMAATGETEAALVARWRAGEFVGRWLRAESGEPLLVVFPGRPGGPSGPDFRDAVLMSADGDRRYGDIELHLRARGWQTHGHDRNPRYAGVVLHVVRRAEGARMTPLASGGFVPLVEVGAAPAGAPPTAVPPLWPCAALARRLSPAAMRALLHAAGDARFDAHTRTFTARLITAEMPAACRSHAPDPGVGWDYTSDGTPLGEPYASVPARATWSAMDRALCAALAEGLAYGRDRETLRRAGAWLADGGAPDALLRLLPRLPAHETARLEGLLTLHARWEAAGPWALLHAALAEPDAAVAGRRLLAALRVPGGSVSPGRAAILAANVALPATAAWALQHDDQDLLAHARAVYVALPGLPSNQITREMVRQLGLPRQPATARAQQGLQHVWARHCREKRCAGCPCASAE
jgi:hypothetical protein